MTRHVLLAILLAVVFAGSVSAQQELPASSTLIPPATVEAMEALSEEIERLSRRMQESGEWDEDLDQSMTANLNIAILIVDGLLTEALKQATAEVGGVDALVEEILRGDDFEEGALQALQALGGGVQGQPMTEDEIREIIVRFRENGLSGVLPEAGR